MRESKDYEEAVSGIRAMLRMMGEDPSREGLIGTPDRVIRAMLEMTAGSRKSPEKYLEVTFESGGYDEVIAVPNIDFVSMCEHHLLPFSGVAHVAYLPRAVRSADRALDTATPMYRVVGLSKIPRVVDAFAMRLQLQEQLTSQIAHALDSKLNPRGVACVIEAKHSCMSCRGVRKTGASMVTSTMLGAFRSDVALRAEVLALLRIKG